ncbi:hypothetical protein JCM1840_004063 [Sporobolomyces johnsonii]
MRSTAIFTALLVLLPAAVLALPGSDDYSPGLYDLGDDGGDLGSEFSSLLDAQSADNEDANTLDASSDADKNIDYNNVQFEDVKYDSTSLKANEHDSDQLKKAELAKDKENKLKEKEQGEEGQEVYKRRLVKL